MTIFFKFLYQNKEHFILNKKTFVIKKNYIIGRLSKKVTKLLQKSNPKRIVQKSLKKFIEKKEKYFLKKISLTKNIYSYALTCYTKLAFFNCYLILLNLHFGGTVFVHYLKSLSFSKVNLTLKNYTRLKSLC